MTTTRGGTRHRPGHRSRCRRRSAGVRLRQRAGAVRNAAGYLLGFRDYLNFWRCSHRHARRTDAVRRQLRHGRRRLTTTTDFDFFRLADDIDEDGIPGAVPIIDPRDWQRADCVIHRLRRSARIQHLLRQRHGSQHDRNRRRRGDVDAPAHEQPLHGQAQNNRVSLSWGCAVPAAVRSVPRRCQGSILHDAFWDTSFTNQIVGPQVGLSWVNQRQRWR